MGLDENKVNFTAQHNFLIEFWEEENLVSRPVFCPVAFYTLYNSTWSLDMFRSSRILFATTLYSFQAKVAGKSRLQVHFLPLLQQLPAILSLQQST